MGRIKRTTIVSYKQAFLLFIALGFLFLFPACSPKQPQQQQSTTQLNSSQLAQPNGAQPAFSEAEDGQWPMPAKNYASTRFSGLNQINTENVKNLKVAWTFDTGVNRGQEAAPIVVGNTMYVLTPYPNILYALDLTQPGAPVKWKYEPRPASAAQSVACCDVVTRGCVFSTVKSSSIH
jgi:alcohol dehydrogenase (cytochrome c)